MRHLGRLVLVWAALLACVARADTLPASDRTCGPGCPASPQTLQNPEGTPDAARDHWPEGSDAPQLSDVTPVPEPASVLLLGAVIGIVAWRRRAHWH